ncbi:unnamed protein product [Nippostrongylus brasiliensis]|uniref:glucuronosyltransferase n=1 Tax=Nippostrongylus brasiliensis TaxID=27835 RepID=A0A0N4Y4P2_NIPBR|nr:unnamed protein product [Nippostrongylus brasiliensis]
MRLLSILLLHILATINAYKILIYSAPLGYSHTTFMGRIADILQDAGHDVMLFALPEKLREELQPGMLEVWEASSISEQLRLLTTHTVSQLRTCDLLLGDNRTMQLLADEHFDAGITEVLGTCGYGIFDKVGIDHIISTTALGILDTMGDLYDLPRLPSITPC